MKWWKKIESRGTLSRTGGSHRPYPPQLQCQTNHNPGVLFLHFHFHNFNTKSQKRRSVRGRCNCTVAELGMRKKFHICHDYPMPFHVPENEERVVGAVLWSVHNRRSCVFQSTLARAWVDWRVGRLTVCFFVVGWISATDPTESHCRRWWWGRWWWWAKN